MRPWGYGIWERMQRLIDDRIRALGYDNTYFPLFIPLSYFEKEAEHVEGFAKEMAVVTHHRLIPDGKGGLMPDPAAKLDQLTEPPGRRCHFRHGMVQHVSAVIALRSNPRAEVFKNTSSPPAAWSRISYLHRRIYLSSPCPRNCPR